jgi:hydroxyethylthiazole kinase-like uncharacterized protein yjeF
MSRAHAVDAEILASMPIPFPRGETDKDSRGKVLIVGGSRCSPGGAMLSGMAALRAGAGKALLAVPQSLAIPVAANFLEAGVTPFSETAEGHPAMAAVHDVCALAEQADAVLIGPGFMDEDSARQLTLGLLERVAGPVFVVDGVAMTGIWHAGAILRRHDGRIVLTPHAGEMAHLMGMSKDRVLDEPLKAARAAAEQLSSTIVLKGGTTYIATPAAGDYRHEGGCVGLATAGSGDVLAGILAALCARGAPPLAASLWSVWIHGRAGERLAQRIGPLGFLARELLTEIPALLLPPRSE